MPQRPLVTSEREISKSVAKRLEVWKLTGVVVWWLRINSGRVQTTHGTWLQLAPKGTSDFIAILINKMYQLHVMFIETKTQTGLLTKEQKEFMDEYSKYPNISYHIIRNTKDLDQIINHIGYDKTKDLPDEI